MSVSISIILATHDRPECLMRAVRSIIVQTRLPDEIIIVNDGQEAVPDEIPALALGAGVKVKSIRRTVASLPASRNCGAEVAESDIVQFLDDDAVLPENHLARLAEMYACDVESVVAGIGARVIEPSNKAFSRRLWLVVAAALGRVRWSPRRQACRYTHLPAGLRGKLVVPRLLGGGALSLRRSIALAHRFHEGFTGYALGEDMEFFFRVTRTEPMFLAPGLSIYHEPFSVGRPDMYARGRMQVSNSLHIIRHSTDARAGTYLLFGYDMVGSICQYGLWGLLRPARGNLSFARGMVRELLVRAKRWIRSLLCGC